MTVGSIPRSERNATVAGEEDGTVYEYNLEGHRRDVRVITRTLTSGFQGNESSLELCGSFRIFLDYYFQHHRCFTLQVERRPERIDFPLLRPQANRADRFAHRSQEPDRTFGDYDVGCFVFAQ